MKNKKDNIIVTKTFDFACDVIDLEDKLIEKRRFVLSKQVVGSGMSIGANVREAQSAESKADFIHKLKIASKEAEETEHWLLLCKHSKSYPDCDNLLLQITSILKVLGKIISSSRK